MEDVGASTRQFDTFRSQARAGASIEAAMVQTEVPPHVRAFVMQTMMLAQTGSTEEVLAAFFYGREDIIPEMFSRLRKVLPGARKTNDPLRHFVYYIERHIELDGDSHGPMGRELLDGLVAGLPQKDERALHAACNSIRARIELWDGTVSILRDMRTKEGYAPYPSWRTADGRSPGGLRTSALTRQDTDPPLPGGGPVSCAKVAVAGALSRCLPASRYFAVAMIDQTRNDHALQSNAVHVRITFLERQLLVQSSRSRPIPRSWT